MKGTFTVANEFYKSSQNGAPAKETAELFAAKNDRASFQIVVDAGGEACRVNTGTMPGIGMNAGRTVYRAAVSAPPFQTRLYAEGYLPDGENVLFADMLDTAPLKDYDGTVRPAIWADVIVPPDAAAGRYTITISLYASAGAFGERLLEKKEIPLTVYDRVMPRPEDYKIYLDLWQHNSNLARYYGVDLWSDEHFEHIERAVATLARLGQKSVTVLLGDCPWQGWGCHLMQSTPAELYEYSLARIEKDENGRYVYDFSRLERYIELCGKYGINGDISVYGLLGIWKMPFFPAEKTDHCENVLIRYLDRGDGAYKYMGTSEEIAEFIAAAFRFFKEKGWFERVLISGDEPADMTAYRKSAEFIRSVEPDVKFKLALDHAEVIDEFANSLKCCAASFPCSCSRGRFLNEWKNDGRKLLFYVCNIPDRPNTVFKNKLTEAVFLGAFAYYFKFDGFLRWAHYCWTADPRKDVRYNNFGLPAGDVCLIYPDRRGGMLESLRYKALQRGIQAFELLSRMPREKAEKLLSPLFYSKDAKTYMKDDRHTAEFFRSDDETYLSFMKSLLSGE